MKIVSRFAPSPTGFIHVGNIRTALINWLFTQKHNGDFILRIDDTDKERSKPEYITQIKEDLKWLGLKWQHSFKQSDNLNRYAIAKQKLIDNGRLYACYETSEELDIKRKILINRGLPPIYDRSALKLSDIEKNKLERIGRTPHYRFKLDHNIIKWHDLIRGNIMFEGNNLSDPILIREDGSMTYMLCSVVDDIDCAISHVVRGEDHLSNTAISIQLIQALSGNIPNFAHLSLLKSKDAQISKRDGGFSIKELRESHIEPMTINSLLARIGSSQPIKIFDNLNQLIENFDFKHFSKAPSIYNPRDILRLNHKLLNQISYQYIKPSLDKVGIQIDENFWYSVRNNIDTVYDLVDWWYICKTKITPKIAVDDIEFLTTAKMQLPEGIWDSNTWETWISKIKSVSDRSGKKLFMPLRLALTSRNSGPELKVILPLIGQDKVKKRLQGIIA